jgi:hypothetical protein
MLLRSLCRTLLWLKALLRLGVRERVLLLCYLLLLLLLLLVLLQLLDLLLCCPISPQSLREWRLLLLLPWQSPILLLLLPWQSPILLLPLMAAVELVPLLLSLLGMPMAVLAANLPMSMSPRVRGCWLGLSPAKCYIQPLLHLLLLCACWAVACPVGKISWGERTYPNSGAKQKQNCNS